MEIMFDDKKIDCLIDRLGYDFKNRNLLHTSLQHSSIVNEIKTKNCDCVIESNERMEFLGDSIIGAIVSEYLYKIIPPLCEYEMTAVKAYVVSRTNMSLISRKIGLEEYFLTSGITLDMRNNSKISADMLESFIGAVYLDSSYETASEIVIKLFKESIEEKIIFRSFKNYKSMLQEYCASYYKCVPEYRIIKSVGEEHKKVFTVEVFINGEKYGEGSGRRIKDAEKQAAAMALARINNIK